MENMNLKFKASYGDATLEEYIIEILKFENALNKDQYREDLGYIFDGLFGQSNLTIREAANKLISEAAARGLLFELWHLNETGEMYDSEFRKS